MPQNIENWRFNAFSLYNLYVYDLALCMTPCPGRNEFYNFGTPLLGKNDYIYVLRLSDLCLEVTTKI